MDPMFASAASLLSGVAMALAEAVLISRLMLVSLLSERNSILANSIRAACLTSQQVSA